MKNGTKVDITHLENAVVVSNHGRKVAYVAFEDIPKVIMSAEAGDRLEFINMMDCFVCNTIGNLLLDMEQVSANFKWRDRLIAMEEARDDGLLPAHALDFEYAPY